MSLKRAIAVISSRTFVRTAFTLFFAGAMVQLWLFAQWALGKGPYVSRPECVVGIIPIGAFGSFFAWVREGSWDTVLPAGLVIIIGALLTSTLLKRGFCGWVCPVGGFFELPAMLGRRLLPRRRNLPIARWLDLALRGVRYAIAAYAVYLLAIQLPASVFIDFRQLPYYAAADVKIVSYFVHPPLWWLLAGLAVAAASFAWGNVWCRFLCPLGGLYGALGTCSPANVVRDPEICTSCRKCARVCPARVPVDALEVVRAPECDGCQTCVRACPEPGALTPRLLGRVVLPAGWWPVLVVALWLFVYAVAVFTGNWKAGVPVDYLAEAVRSLGL